MPEEEFAAAHARLDETLPGKGPIHERFVSWRETQEVPVDLVGQGLERLAAELRKQTDALFGLPEDQVDFVLETGKPWGGQLRLPRRRPRPRLDQHGRPYLVLAVARARHTRGLPGPSHGRSLQRTADRRRPTRARHRPVPHAALRRSRGDREARARDPLRRRRRPRGRGDPAPPGDPVRRGDRQGRSFGSRDARLGRTEPRADDRRGHHASRRGMGVRAPLADRVRTSSIERSVALLDGPWPQYAICYPAGLALARRFVDGDPERFARLLREELTPQDLAA